jgi:hypothetical protein
MATIAALVAVGALTRPAAAQNLEEYDYANLGFRAIGGEILFIDPTQNEGTFGLGLRADLGFLGPGIRVVPRFAYWKADVNSQSVTELELQLEEVSELPPGSINLGQIQRSAYVFGADLQYITSVSTISPYIGAGVDIYALNDDGNAISGTFLDDAVVTAGLSAVGGLQFALSPDWSAYGEFRATAITDASSLGGAFGIYYTFGP